MKSSKISVKDLCLMSLMLATLIICSKVSFPIGEISITMQTFAIVLIALILGFYKTTIVLVIYIILGLIGIPVFSTGGGFAYIFKPSFGYIIGFVFEGMIISLASRSEKRYLKYILGVVGLFVDYFLGTLYFALLMAYNGAPKEISYILSVCVTPFIIKDLISIGIAGVIYSRIKNLIWQPNETYEISYDVKENHN